MRSNCEIGPRRVMDHLLMWIPEGSVHYIVGRRTGVAETGQAIWIQPGVDHHLTYPARGRKVELVYWRFALGSKKSLRVEPDLLLHRDLLLHPGAMPMEHTGGRLPELEELQQRSRIADLALTLIRSAARPSVRGRFRREERERIRRFIQANIRDRLSPSDLARHMHRNADYLSRRFKKTFSMSPRAYIKQERIRATIHAVRESSQPIGEIAREYGYDDVQLFSRQFREVTGQSPMQMRKIGNDH